MFQLFRTAIIRLHVSEMQKENYMAIKYAQLKHVAILYLL
jgi:hypothetical protein